MGERVRRIGFAVTVVALAAIMYFFVSKRSDVGDTLLESSLNMLGQKLMAIVPDDTGKDNLAALYSDFKQQAVNKKLPPEKIEVVAANILNLSNLEQGLTPEQAETFLRSAMVAPTPPAMPVPPEPDAKPEAANKEMADWHHLGKRLHDMVKFNDEVHRFAVSSVQDWKDVARHIHFRVENGLKLQVDERLRSELADEPFAKKLEREKSLMWRENVREECEKEVANFHREMESMNVVLKSLKGVEALESLRALESLNGLESLKHLESLRELQHADPDSIEAIVIRSLKMSGIDVDIDSEKKAKSETARARASAGDQTKGRNQP